MASRSEEADFGVGIRARVVIYFLLTAVEPGGRCRARYRRGHTFDHASISLPFATARGALSVLSLLQPSR